MTKTITKLLLNGNTYQIKEYNPRITLFDGSSIAQGAGIFHNPEEGVISISSDGTNRITIADKNLGATTVYNDGDALISENCGGYFQRGNNYMFPFSGEILNDTTQVDTTGYGPGNYYSSDTFIRGVDNWSSTDNKNLRGGQTPGVTNKQGPCPSGYHIPSNGEYSTTVNALTALGINTEGGDCLQQYLKMPRAGARHNSMNGMQQNLGVRGFYWTTIAGPNPWAHYLNRWSSRITIAYYERAQGCSIRPFKDDPIHP